MSRAQLIKSEIELDDSTTPPPTPGRRIRKPQRPRLMPLEMREKLALLGHPPVSNGTGRENLSELNDRLSADLKHYRALAERWEKKYIDLERAKNPPKPAPKPAAARKLRIKSETRSASPGPQDPDFVPPAFESYVHGRIESVIHPSLSLVQLEAPRIQSIVKPLISDSTFHAAMAALENLTTLYKVPISKEYFRNKPGVPMKPDFDMQKAFRIWNDVFERMDFHPSSVQLNASSSCRSSPTIELDDPDYDHFDRVLTGATDFEVIDMLQYVAMLIGAMHQLVFDDPTLAPARAHLGRSCERLIREAIFSRNLSSHPHVARSLLDGLMGSICHFSTHERASAVSSVLSMAWSILTQHSNEFNPTSRMFLSLYALLTARTEAQRKTWMQRIEEAMMLCRPAKPFPALMMNSFAAAYNALRADDESTLLQHILMIEEYLAPEPSPSDICEFLQRFQPVYPQTHSNENFFTSELPFDVPPFLESHYPSHTSNHRVDILQSPSEETDFDWAWSSSDAELSVIPPSYQVSSFDPTSMDHQGKFLLTVENWKSLHRIPLLLLRAEAALAVQDYETCMQWVDEAEKTMLSIPLDYMFQRVFLMKNVIKTTCPFPTGERSVVDEFELRMIAHDVSRCAAPSIERVAVGALWRTP